MATLVETVERDGRIVKVYDNGMERDERGRIIKPSPATMINSTEKANELHRKRREKTARLLREAIVSETGDLLQVKTSGSAAAVAAAGGILWREIVLNPDAYPRDRLDAWQKLGQHADILGDGSEKAQEAGAGDAANVLTAATELLKAMQSALQQRDNVVDGIVNDG